jgi:hypothetical protein
MAARRASELPARTTFGGLVRSRRGVQNPADTGPCVPAGVGLDACEGTVTVVDGLRRGGLLRCQVPG